jgi:molybdopterin-binding protein
MADLGTKFIGSGRIKTIEKFDEILVGVIVTLTVQHRFIIFSTILRQSIEKCLLYTGKKSITLSDMQNASY